MGGRFTSLRALVAALMITAALLAGCASNERHDRSFPAEAAEQIDRVVQPQREARLAPGALVAVHDPKRGVFMRAYGTADLATGRPMDVADQVRIGSITKTFTATAVLRAADEGKLSLDDVLERYVPGVPNGDAITLRDLLGMRGGVWDLRQEQAFAEQIVAKTPASEWHEGDRLRAIIAHPEKAMPPRERVEYSNSEYYLLGLVLEKVLGKPVHQVIGEVAAAHGLRATTYPTDTTIPAPEGHGYSYFDETPTDVTARTTPALFGAAGSMVSTISDLAEYARLLGRGDLLKPETFRARTQFAGDLRYGLGMVEFGRWIGHNGAVPGYTTHMAYLPEQDVSVTVAVSEFTSPPLLGVTASVIWFGIVRQLYPGTVPGAPATTEPAPPVPAVADLDNRLRQTLDPAVPVARKPLRIADDDKDPELVTRLAQALAPTTTTVGKATDAGGHLLATVVFAGPGGRRPAVVPFVPRDGSWRLDPHWACENIAGIGSPSPACE
ncbi:serine hydrolase domain-containing protein [Nocardia beijingensis]|uniref:serine hydrolase domain-containing protein n=1 Tax=Nocardia beijingensis TaxID=95162 RepID=UPI00082D4070|nr:serine hydrolase domain-containing protein [Nocardia beijingensis]